MEMHAGMALQPAILLGFVGVEIIEYHMDLPFWMAGDELIHKVQKLSSPPSVVMPRKNLAGSDVEGRKQRGGAVSLVAVATSAQRLAIG